MKVKILHLLFFAMIITISGSCQRDDICPESEDTTPLLIIRFYENEDPFEPKAPQNLSVRSIGNDSSFVYRRFSQDSIAIPLKTNNDKTEYVFTLNTPPDGDEAQEDQSNSDIITFTYGREEEYINRACAFKINYVSLKMNVVEPEGSDENWIKDIRIEQANIINENQSHVSIFF